MEKNWNIYLKLLCITFTFCFLTGCVKTEKTLTELEKYTLAAEEYYEEKYNCDIDITDSYYKSSNSLSNPQTLTDDIIFKTSENTTIYFDADTYRFLDTKQSKKICDYILNEFFPKIFSENSLDYYPASNIINCNQIYLGPNSLVSVFHEYFDSNYSEDFFVSEHPNYAYGRFFIKIDPSDDHSEIANSLSSKFRKYFNLETMHLYFVTKDYEIDYESVDFLNDEGFIAAYSINNDEIFCSEK